MIYSDHLDTKLLTHTLERRRNKMYLNCLVAIFTLFVDIVSTQNCNGKFKQEDIIDMFSSAEKQLISEIRQRNTELPLTCRKEVCQPQTVTDDMKGSLSLPLTPLANRVYIRCPFSLNGSEFIQADCILDQDANVSWAMPRGMEECPGPPLYREIRLLYQNATDWRPPSSLNQTIKIFETLYDVIQRFTNMPITAAGQELEVVINVTSQVVGFIAEGIVSYEKLDDVINMADFLMSYEFVAGMTGYTSLMSRLIQKIVALDRVACDRSECDKLSVTSANKRIRVVMKRVKQGETHEFIDDMPAVSVNVHGDNSSLACVTVTHFRINYNSILYDIISNSSTSSDLDRGHDTTRINTKTFDANGDENTLERNDTMHFSNDSILRPPDIELQREFGLSMTGGITFISAVPDEMSSDQRLTALVTLTYVTGNSHLLDNQTICATASVGENNNTSQDVDLTTWYSMAGKTCEMFTEWNRTTCVCRGGSFHSLFATQKDKSDSTTHQEEPDDAACLCTLLGFPYSYELFIAGHVFRAISLVCLVLTIASFTLFGKSKRGRPTVILLHLSTSLIALNIVLYVGEVIGHTKLGCMLASILRYYLVMVSLFWNAMEAYNMYLMLVKVFDHGTSKFLYKASAVAWGTPVVMLVIILVADTAGFDGGCKLPESTLYYGYLLPMAIIILHNIIVFILVTRVLLSKRPLTEGQDAQSSDGWRQLSGAVAMLVLLGVPWVFSSFGAISNEATGTLKMVEAVFQIVFAVTINLQGLFIFLFHCVRSRELRRSWHSSLSLSKFDQQPKNTSQTNSTKIEQVNVL